MFDEVVIVIKILKNKKIRDTFIRIYFKSICLQKNIKFLD